MPAMAHDDEGITVHGSNRGGSENERGWWLRSSGDSHGSARALCTPMATKAREEESRASGEVRASEGGREGAQALPIKAAVPVEEVGAPARAWPPRIGHASHIGAIPRARGRRWCGNCGMHVVSSNYLVKMWLN